MYIGEAYLFQKVQCMFHLLHHYLLILSTLLLRRISSSDETTTTPVSPDGEPKGADSEKEAVERAHREQQDDDDCVFISETKPIKKKVRYISLSYYWVM